MIWWLVDHVNVLYLLLIFAGLAFALIYRQNRHSKYLIYLGVLVVIAGIFWLTARFVITDRKQLEINIRELADAALTHHADKIQSLLAPEFEFQTLKGDAVAKRIAQTAKAARVNSYHIWDFTVDEIGPDRRTAKVTFRLRVDAASEQTHMLLCRGSFVRTNDRWLLRTFSLHNPIANTDEKISVPLH